MGQLAFKRLVEVRLALDSEGPAIAELLAKTGSPIGSWLKFERVAPHWLLALYAGVPVGAIALCYSRPIGFLELLVIRPDLVGPQRGIVFRMLTDLAMATMKLYPGCEAVACLVGFEDRRFTRVAKRNGFVRIGSGNLLMRRV